MNRLLYLTAALIALVVVAWVSGMFGGPASTVDLPEIDLGSSDEITRVDVKNGNDHVQAHRLDSGEWRLDAPVEANADTATVMRLVRGIADIDLESIVSSNADRFDRFQVDSSGNRLAVAWKDKRFELIVGKMGPDFQSRYVRLEGDNRVMLANGVPTLNARADQWRDKTLWAVPNGAIAKISVGIEDGGDYTLVRTGAGWDLEVGSEILVPDSSAVVRLADQLSSMKADGFQSGLTIDSVLANVTHRLQIELTNGSMETLLMSKRTSDVAAVREGSGDVFKLFSHRLTSLTPDLEEITAAATTNEVR